MADRKKPKRLVYSPKAYVFIRSYKTGQIVDVSNDVVGGSINRLINQPSSASVTLKNPNYKYTGRFEPMFEPMDVITIWLQRIAGKPIQVFTGYIDDIPLYQMYPNNIEVNASCTLKRLMHTYFDPGLPEMYAFFAKSGWVFDPQSGQVINPAVVGSLSGQPYADSGLGNMLRRFLVEICGWDAKSVIVSTLPENITTPLTQLYSSKIQGSEDNFEAMRTFFDKLLTMKPSASGTDASADSTVAPGVVADQSTLSRIRTIANNAGAGTGAKPSLFEIILAATVMTRIDKDHSQKKANTVDYGYGIFAIPGDDRQLPSGSAESGPGKALKSSVEFFIARYLDVVKKDKTLSYAKNVALTLSLGFGKDEYYTDILEACNDLTNTNIANTIADTGTPDGVSAETVATATIVASVNNDERVTWDKLMSTETSEIETTDYDGEGIIKNSGVTYKISAERETVPQSTVFYDSLGKNMKIDLNKLKYYVVERGRKATAVATGGNLGDLPIGAILRITNPKNGKSVTAMVADRSEKSSPPMGLSPAVLNDLRLTNSKDTSWSGDVYVEYNSDVEFTLEDMVDPKASTYEVKPEKINSLSPALGVGGAGTGSFRFKNINENDRNAYNDWYKGKASDILAEYFFVANDMGLRLAVPGGASNKSNSPERKYVLSVQPDASNSNSSYLDKFAKWASTQIGIAYVARSDGESYYEYTNGVAGSKKSLNISQTISDGIFLYPNQVVVKIKNNAPRPIYNGSTVDLPIAEEQQTAGATGQEVHWQDLAKLGLASSFTTNFSLPTNYIESFLLKGDRALMNDIPVFVGVKQFAFASMRQFMSLPNGQFVAFYPDTFGTFGRTPYWPIFDIEIEDLNINRNDTELITHMYVNGAVLNPQSGVQLWDKITSLGLITIEDMLESGFITLPPGSKKIVGPNEGTTPSAAGPSSPPATPPRVETLKMSYEFLQKYGARPLSKDDPLIRSPFFEFVSAVNEFLYHWGKTFSTTAKIAFQPELMAGGIVYFPEHDNLRLYTEQVTHVWDYSSGFQTQAVFSSPHQPVGGSIPGIPESGSTAG